jgi:hypothetical protein
MQICSDMTFTGPTQELQNLLVNLDTYQSLAEWHRDLGAEADIARLLPKEDVVRCFKNLSAKDEVIARLWLDIEPDVWKVTNIVPERDSIPPATYNALLISFRNAILPLVSGTRIAVSKPVMEVGPEHWLSSNAARLLRQFSSTANKSTGAGHPRDRARWNAFVIAAHQDRSTLSGEELRTILVEDENWPEEKANELAILFEHERTVLEDFVKSA